MQMLYEKDTLKLKNDSQLLIEESSEGDVSKTKQLEKFNELLKDSA